MRECKNILMVYSFMLSFLMAGCAATVEDIYEVPRPSSIKKGVYHKVGKGQTLWRIAKTYNASLNEIILSNNIPNVAKVEENQLIFIPGADKVLFISAEDKDHDRDSDFIWPIKGKILKYFRESTGSAFSNGIDIAPQEGTTVKASRSGKVVLADDLAGYGNTVILDHGDSYYSVYAHNGKLLVNFGDSIKQGDDLAYLGRTGNQPYLHFEIRKNSVADNPLYYLP